MECHRARQRGWFRDPFGCHEDRYISMGRPTKLVRDGGVESYDPPPRGRRMRWPLVDVVPGTGTVNEFSDQRRADDAQRGRVVDFYRAAVDALTRYGSSD